MLPKKRGLTAVRISLAVEAARIPVIELVVQHLHNLAIFLVLRISNGHQFENAETFGYGRAAS